MNYISLQKIFDLDINSLSDLNQSKIYQLQELLREKTSASKLTDKYQILTYIENLQHQNFVKNLVFVEKHHWLKQIISGNYNDILQNSVKVNSQLIENEDELKQFLDPYFKTHIIPFLEETFEKEKHLLLINFVENKKLFSEDIKQLIISFYISKLNVAKDYIKSGKYQGNLSTISYIHNRNFIKCLSVYSSSFTTEVNDLNSEITDIYNDYRQFSNDPILTFSAKTMVAFGEFETSIKGLKEVLDSNAYLAKPNAYKLSNSSKKKSKSNSKISTWSIIVIILLVLRFGFKIAKNFINNNDNIKQEQNNYLNQAYDGDFQNAIEEIKRQQGNNTNSSDSNGKTTLPEGSNKTKSKNHIRFLYTLKLKTNRKNDYLDENQKVDIQDFTNPYPNTFNLIKSSSSDAAGYSLLKNETKNDLIVFRLKKGIDEAVYIPKDKNVFLELKKGDSIMFYYGSDFIVTKFSSFKQNTNLTNLYKLNSNSPNNVIEVLPRTINTYKKTNSQNTVTDTTFVDNIETERIKLGKLNLDRIYANWYRDYINYR